MNHSSNVETNTHYINILSSLIFLFQTFTSVDLKDKNEENAWNNQDWPESIDSDGQYSLYEQNSYR